jgi:hypothetical protein
MILVLRCSGPELAVRVAGYLRFVPQLTTGTSCDCQPIVGPWGALTFAERRDQHLREPVIRLKIRMQDKLTGAHDLPTIGH